MTEFVKCPFCCGTEKVSDGALDAIESAIWEWLHIPRPESDTVTEMWNIRNVILNALERTSPVVPEYEAPICPTPGKRKYSNPEHAEPDAGRWHQHSYRCACGFWHLSKQTAAEHAAKINTSAASADEFDAIAIDPLLE